MSTSSFTQRGYAQVIMEELGEVVRSRSVNAKTPWVDITFKEYKRSHISMLVDS